MSATAGEDLSRTLVLNGLRDLFGAAEVLADANSRTTLEDAADAALDADERDRLGGVVVDLETAPGEDPGEEAGQFLDDVAGAVLDELIARDVRGTLVHEAVLSVAPREAALYTFMVGHDPGALADLALPGAVREAVEAGALAVAEGDHDLARERFDTAVDAAGAGAPGSGAVVARVLAAHASHLAGQDDLAIDYVEETLHLDTGAWPAKLVGYAADHRYPGKFRDGKLGARVFFRWSTEVPADASITVAVGPTGGEPTQLEGRDECMPLEALWPETTVRVELTGALPSVPTVESYYVATGVVDREVFEARTVESVLLSGPATANATERVRFE